MGSPQAAVPTPQFCDSSFANTIFFLQPLIGYLLALSISCVYQLYSTVANTNNKLANIRLFVCILVVIFTICTVHLCRHMYVTCHLTRVQSSMVAVDFGQFCLMAEREASFDAHLGASSH